MKESPLNDELSNDLVEISSPEVHSRQPAVSVVMITYNHGDFIKRAVESVMAQSTDYPYELIISDDCSTDNTRELVLHLQDKYPDRIRVFYSSKNVGVNNNFARALKQCRGQFIALCEGDDYWNDPNKLEVQLSFLTQNSEVVVTFHDAATVDQEGNLLSSSKINSITNKSGQSYPQEQLIRYAFMPTLTICFRNVLNELPEEFFKVMNADTFIISLLGNYGSAYFHSEIKPAVYLKHTGGIWSSLAENVAPIRQIETFYWLAIYYKRIGNIKVSNHFISNSLVILYRYNSESFFNKLKIFLWSNSSLYRRLRACFSG